MDANDNELAYLEAIHFFVEVLDSFFGNVCELDLVFNFYKVCPFPLIEGGGGEERGKRVGGNLWGDRADMFVGNRSMRSWMRCFWRGRLRRRVSRLC